MKSKDDVNLDTFLSEIKILGTYHCRLFVLLFFCSVVAIWQGTNYIFAVENVDYKCKYMECLDGVSVSLNPTMDHRCQKYKVLSENDTCTVHNANSSEACEQWDYDNPDSFVAEFNLACEDWKRTLIGTLHSAGYMTGLLFLGPISDKIGRKKLIIFTAVAGGVLGLTKSFASNYWLYAVLEFLEPLIGDSYSAIHVMAVEMVTKEYRSLAVSILSLSIAASGITKALFAWLVPYWRNFLRVIYAPSLLFILYIFLMDESFRWLLNKGKKEKLKKLIKKAANLNKVTIDEKKLANIEVPEETTKIDQRTLLKMTLTSKKMFSRLLCCIVLWFSTVFGVFVLIINSVSLQGDKYLNYGLLSLSDIPNSVILYYLLKKCKRKIPIISTLIMASVFCTGNTFTPVEYRWLSTALYIAGKMSVSLSLRIVYLYTSELFPTYTRNTMHAWCSAIGRTAAVLAPQTPLLIPYWAGLPSLLVAMLSLLTACIVSFMPDTSEDILPENIQQAEALGQKEKEIKVYYISSRM